LANAYDAGTGTLATASSGGTAGAGYFTVSGYSISVPSGATLASAGVQVTVRASFGNLSRWNTTTTPPTVQAFAGSTALTSAIALSSSGTTVVAGLTSYTVSLPGVTIEQASEANFSIRYAVAKANTTADTANLDYAELSVPYSVDNFDWAQVVDSTAGVSSLSDVDTTGAADGNSLLYSAAASKWVAGSVTPPSVLTSTVLVSPQERINTSATAATGTVNIDTETASVWYLSSNATANFTINVRSNSTTTLNSVLAVGDSITVSVLNTTGATAFYPTAVQVDGVTRTVRWQGGSAPTSGNASSIDAYVFTITKTAATPTYLVLGSQTQFA
jgi:hypothetical protein